MDVQSLTKLAILYGCLTARIVTCSATADELRDRLSLLQEFQDLQVVPASGGYLIVPGKFPELRWEQPYLVRELFGEFPLQVRWFDAVGIETDKARLPGRFGAYIEGNAPDGTHIRRAATYFCVDPAVAKTASQEFPPHLVDIPIFGLSQDVWNAHREEIDRFVLDSVMRSVQRDPQAAILAAGIAEWDPKLPRILSTPSARNQEYHLRIKRRILGVENKYPKLQRPLRQEARAPVLREGTPAEAGLNDELPGKLRAFCQKWHDEVGQPFTIVVARKGVIVFHEAYGKSDDRLVTRDTAYPLFSLTKSLTGVMLASFLDQKLLDLDSPLGEVLPDLPTEGPNVITLRQCFMHVTGLDGHNRWGGPDNPWFENVIANGIEGTKPGYRYSGMGYDLAGMAMQLVSGKSIPRLFHEHLFEPLEFAKARITDLGSGGHLRAIDLARIGQLLLNGGAYGEYRFFDEKTFNEFLPKSYKEFFPGLTDDANDYGLGIYWAGEIHPRAGQNGMPNDATIMSRRTIGHGAFSGTVFRVDLENEIVVVVGRFNSGDKHGDYVKSLLMTVMGSLPADAKVSP